MKGVQGLVLALALGLGGAVCNWFYLERLAGREAKVAFIGIRGDVQMNIGDVLRRDQLIRVDIPRSAVGNLEQVAPLWDRLETVIGMPCTRSYLGGELVLQQDLRTQSSKDLNDKIGQGEVAVWIPVDTRTFNSSRVNPDDDVSFVLPRTAYEIPEAPPAVENADATKQPASQSVAQSEIIGPFRILEIGNRTGRPEVFRAAGARQSIETSITIVAKLEKAHLDNKTERLLEYIRSTKSQGLQVILHPKQKK